jgi:hypothetical protein
MSRRSGSVRLFRLGGARSFLSFVAAMSACAVRAGTHVDTGHTGGSYEACCCFDRLERALGIKLPHIHYIKGGGTEGSEEKGLIPGRQYRPDSYVSGSLISSCIFACEM